MLPAPNALLRGAALAGVEVVVSLKRLVLVLLASVSAAVANGGLRSPS